MNQRTLTGAGDPGDDGEESRRNIDVDILKIILPCATDLQSSRGLPHRFLEAGAVVEVAAGDGIAPPQPLNRALEHQFATSCPGAGTEVHHMVGDRDRLRLVLDDQHGVALVPQPEQQIVHPGNVVRVQTDGRFVEDIRDVSQRGTEVADHLGALGFSPGQRAGRPIEAQVAEPNLDEGVKAFLQRRQQRRHRWLVEPADPFDQLVDLHGTRVRDADPVDF